MASLVTFSVDDNDLEDAALWAVIDSAVASHSSSKSRNPLPLKNSNPNPIQNPSPQPPSSFKIPINRNFAENNVVDLVEGEVLQEPWEHHRPQKMARYCVSEVSETSPLAVVKHVQRSPATLAYPSSHVQRSPATLAYPSSHVQRSPTMPAYSSPPMYSSPSDTGRFCVKELTPVLERAPMNCRLDNENGVMRHSLSGSFPSVSLFKQYQNAAMAILEKPDYTMISGNPYIKKSGWRKISFYFNLSYEIKDKTIEFDENRNVQRAEFVVRAHMQGGRYSDGWGSCERREKRFSKPNHDIPSTAETRAKNKACQDLLGIGEYRPGAKA